MPKILIMRITKTKTAAVIIDYQERLLPHMRNHEDTLENVVKLIKGLKILNIPTILTQQYTRGLGETVAPIKELFDDFKFVEKTSFSCYDAPDFAIQLETLGKEFVIVAGIESHVCVLQTVLDLKENGHIPVVIEDCINSRKKNDKRIAMARFRQEGIIVASVESILFELTRTAKAEEFKAISNLVK